METRGKSFWWWLGSAMPLLIIAGLMYAALFIKPSGGGAAVPEPVLDARDRFYGVSVASDGAVVAVGGDGKILLGNIAAGPASLTPARSGTPETLQAVARWDDGRLVAVGNDGVVVVSGDGGQSWTAVEAPRSSVANRLVRVKALAGGSAFAVGEFNALLHSRDFGKTWKRLIAEKDSVLYGIDVLGAAAVAVGEFGRILVSGDGGGNWAEIQSPLKVHLTAVAFGAESRVVAVGLNGAALLSKDAGRSWAVSQTGSEDHLYDVVWNGSRYLAVGERGAIFTSSDGEAWARLDSGLGVGANYVWFMQAQPVGNQHVVVGAGIGVIDASGKVSPVGSPAPAKG